MTSEKVLTDDTIENILKCSWYKDLVRIGTIRDGSSFLHAVLKACDDEYQSNDSYNFRTKKSYKLRVDLANILTLPNPRYPTEYGARSLLWKSFNLDNDSSLLSYMNNIKMIYFKELPYNKHNWLNYEKEDHKVREYAKTNDILNIKDILGNVPLNSYYFTVKECKLVHLAIENKNQQMKNLHQIIAYLIDKSYYINDIDMIECFAEIIGVNIYICKVCNDDVECLNIIKTEESSHAVLINKITEVHFETIGANRSGSIQTIFTKDDPVIIAFQEKYKINWKKPPKIVIKKSKKIIEKLQR